MPIPTFPLLSILTCSLILAFVVKILKPVFGEALVLPASYTLPIKAVRCSTPVIDGELHVIPPNEPSDPFEDNMRCD